MTTTHRANLTGVPETMLWTLHNRASEARRKDGVLRDPNAVRIYDALDYDYERSFGPAEASHGVRSALFDVEIRNFLLCYPNGVIVNLGEGLETQRFRVEGDEALWITVDLPEAITIRERFIQPDTQHKHVSCSALDTHWFKQVPDDRPVYITAQGLFMYLPEADLEVLFQGIAAKFPNSYLAFDSIPGWLSRKTLSEKGWRRTPHYVTPPMPWGINADKIEPTLRRWVPTLESVKRIHMDFPRGGVRWFTKMVQATPILNRYAPTVTRVQFG